MSLSINIATRKRPDLLRRTLDITLGNISRADTILMVSVDEDDEATRALVPEYLDRVAFSVAPREDSLGAKYNRVMKVAPADVYMVMVDYAPIITKGFDNKVLDAAAVYTDGLAFVYGPMANLSFPCMQAVTHRMAEAMGGIYPLYFPYWFVDHWLDDIARMTGRIVYTDVLPNFWEQRPGTMERREPGFWATFFDQMVHERIAIANSIIDRMDDTPSRKEALRRSFPLIIQHSTMVNNQVRQISNDIEDSSRDARYYAVKANAERMLADMNRPAEAA